MKRRSLKSRFAFLRWTASIALAWPVLSSAMFSTPEPVSVSIGSHWCGTFRIGRPPSVLELLASRHRVETVRPRTRFWFPDPWPASSRGPDGRIVI